LPFLTTPQFIVIFGLTIPLSYTKNQLAKSWSVDLSDGRSISVPIAWFPRLLHSTEQERNNWRLIGKGQGIHWEDIDEDISIEGLLTGKPSGESQESFKKWLAKRSETAF